MELIRLSDVVKHYEVGFMRRCACMERFALGNVELPGVLALVAQIATLPGGLSASALCTRAGTASTCSPTSQSPQQYQRSSSREWGEIIRRCSSKPHSQLIVGSPTSAFIPAFEALNVISKLRYGFQKLHSCIRVGRQQRHRFRKTAGRFSTHVLGRHCSEPNIEPHDELCIGRA
jgi:hypothetical protein